MQRLSERRGLEQIGACRRARFDVAVVRGRVDIGDEASRELVPSTPRGLTVRGRPDVLDGWARSVCGRQTGQGE